MKRRAADEPRTAIDAERALAADAQTLGQWAAFRSWAALDALLFWPQPVNAHAMLKSLKEPARAVEWRPAQSYMSCDGKTAANTGPTLWPGGKVGYFSTIWSARPEGWRWTLYHDFTSANRRAWTSEPKVRRASCANPPQQPPFPPALHSRSGGGRSPDDTLRWVWTNFVSGERALVVWLWNGTNYEVVLHDHVPARP